MGVISIILGAGFSKNMEYPMAADLNVLLLKINPSDYAVSSGGSLIIIDDKVQLKQFQLLNRREYECLCFLCDLMKGFEKQNLGFNYESFFDFLNERNKKNNIVKGIIEKYKELKSDISSSISLSIRIFNQLIIHLLKDGNSQSYYDNLPIKIGHYFPGYSGYFRAIYQLLRFNTIHVHSLNHDLFFESINATDIGHEVSDGFEEFGSPFYGDLNMGGRTYKVRLKRFTGKYFGKLRLYKLHGSIDQLLYHKSEGSSIKRSYNYIKTRFGIRYSDLYMEVKKGKSIKYDPDWVNYHPDVLTGTWSKTERYNEPLLYKKLFNSFKKNLQSSNGLLIIGYGGGDLRVNQIIEKYYKFKKYSVFIVDPDPKNELIEFGKKIDAKILGATPNNLKIEDLKCILKKYKNR
jgi:hypothetical protein